MPEICLRAAHNMTEPKTCLRYIWNQRQDFDLTDIYLRYSKDMAQIPDKCLIYDKYIKCLRYPRDIPEPEIWLLYY